jgi:hypothetical protein
MPPLPLPNGLKITIPDAQGQPTDAVSRGGYIQVFRELVEDPNGFQTFTGPPQGWNTGKADRLATVARNGGGVLSLRIDDPQESVQLADGNNTSIRTEPDQRKNGGQVAKITISMPERSLAVDELDYISINVLEFLRIYTGNDSYPMPNKASPDAKRDAQRFMFAIMLLTKCR